MWKAVKTIAKVMGSVKKYASLIAVILDIVGYASEKLEAWAASNAPKETKTDV